MRSLVSLLNEIRQLAPVGSPLYAFRHTEAQHAELVRTVRHELERGHRDRHVAAAFCLAASRILSTELQRGEWTWRPVNELLFKLHNPGPFIKQGLDYWGRPVVVLETQRWLFTLVAEGGLPIHLVQEEGSIISSFFARLLALAEGSAGADVAEIVPRCFGMLPESLRNDAVRQLSIDLIGLVKELRSASDGQVDRIAFLDRERPEWRRRLPLLVDDTTSHKLLSGLLEAPKPTSALASTGIPVTTWLQRASLTSDEYSIAQGIELPSFVSRLGLSRQIGLDLGALPKRFTLNLVGLDGTMAPLATVTHAADDALFHLEANRRSIRLGQVSGPILLQASRQGAELGPAVRISQELGEMPWVFADDESEQELLSVGPCSTTRKSVLVAATDSTSVKALEDEVYDSAATLVGTLLEDERFLYRVHGKVRVRVGDELFTIRTDATHDEAFSVFTRGSRVALQSGLVWLGLPRFFVDESGGDRELSTSAISWRPKGSVGTWHAIDRDCVGDVQVRVKWQGQVIHRSNESILPRQFSFELKPDATSGRGSIRLRGVGQARVVSGPGSEHMSMRIATDGPGSLLLTCESRTERTDVPLRFIFGATEHTARLPFPGHFVGFVDAAGTPVKVGAHVDVARLHGIRARVVANGRAGDYVVWGRADKVPEVALAPLQRGPGGVAELSLGHVQQLVEALLSEGLDATAQLYIEAKGSVVRSAGRHQGIKVHWYGNRLWCHFAGSEQYDDEEPQSQRSAADVPIALRSPNDSDVPVRLFAHRLTDPAMAERDELPGTESGGWTFRTSGREPGPWIVTGWRGDALLCRPSLVLVPSPETKPSCNTGSDDAVGVGLGHAGKLPSPSPVYFLRDSIQPTPGCEAGEMAPSLEAIVQRRSRTERQALMRAAASRMAEDASDPDWDFAQGFLDSMKLFPADSYEFNRAIMEQPRVTALAMLRSAFLNRIDHLWTGFEQFHFLWVTFPVRAWIQAVRCYRDTAFPGVPEESRGPLLNLVLERCFSSREGTQYRSVIWDLCSRSIYGVPAPPNRIRFANGEQRRSIARLLAQTAMQEVEQQHSEDTYPQLPDTIELLGLEISRAVDALTPNVQMGFRRDVARAPILAAAISVYALQPTRGLVFEIRRTRDFDAKYFDSVYNDSLACLALDAVDKNHAHFN